MPVILAEHDLDRWLSPLAPDPRDRFVPFPSDELELWPISSRVNDPANVNPDILTPLEDKLDREAALDLLAPIFSGLHDSRVIGAGIQW